MSEPRWRFVDALTALDRRIGVVGRHSGPPAMRRALSVLGNPHLKYRVVHVAGTSGKTTTSSIIAAELRAAGACVGMTISPHVHSVCERIQIDGHLISEDGFGQAINRLRIGIGDDLGGLSYFEAITAAAFLDFARADVDVAVVETGIGGRDDATNVFDRGGGIKVITDIGFDHTEILGFDLADIAGHKAGIVHGGDAVVIAADHPDVVFDAVEGRARAVGAAVHRVHIRPQTAPLLRNADLALAAVDVVHGHIPAARREIEPERLRAAVPPGRFELIGWGRAEILLDGAHNPQELRALGWSVERQGMASVVLAMTAAPEHKLASSAAEVARFARRIILPSLEIRGTSVKRFADPAVLERLLVEAGHPQVVRVDDLRSALDVATSDASFPHAIVTGSIYTVAAVHALRLPPV